MERGSRRGGGGRCEGGPCVREDGDDGGGRVGGGRHGHNKQGLLVSLRDVLRISVLLRSLRVVSVFSLVVTVVPLEEETVRHLDFGILPDWCGDLFGRRTDVQPEPSRPLVY